MKFPHILLFCSLIFFVANDVIGQVRNTHKLHFSAAMGVRGTSAELDNLYDESVSSFERSLGLVDARISFRQSKKLILWTHYMNGYNSVEYALAGFDRQQKSVFIGGQASTGNYSASLQYGYQSFRDSLYQDNLFLEQAYRLAGGITPKVGTWIGIGNEDRIEWVLQGGVVISAREQIKIEPILMFSKNGFETEARAHLGLKTHISLFEKGALEFGASRRIKLDSEQAGTVFLFSGAIPFLQSHQLNITLQRNAVNRIRTTILVFGMTLGIGRPD